jgi:hypothetical protein
MAAPKGNRYWKLADYSGREHKYEDISEFKKKCIEYLEKKENDYEEVEETHVKQGIIKAKIVTGKQ